MNTWHEKISASTMSVPELFHRGSDIDGNYPILFGVRDAALKLADTSRSVAIHEVRSLQPLSLQEGITHIEVNRAHITETKAILEHYGHTIPILAIEDCELYAAEEPIIKLMAH